MYTTHEFPTVEIVADVDHVYKHNVKKIVTTDKIDRIMVHAGDLRAGQFKDFVDDLVLNITGKEFYVPYGFQQSWRGNVKTYSTIDWLELDYKQPDEAELIILYCDVIQCGRASMPESKKKILEDMAGLIMVEFYASAIPDIIHCKKALKFIMATHREIHLSGLVKTHPLIKAHPCNAYVCDGATCHSGKNNYPRYLYIDKDGIRPYKTNLDALLFFQDISRVKVDDFESFMNRNYLNSLAHNLFLNINRAIFHSYIVNGDLVYLPWNILMEKVSHETHAWLN